jgi:hypothetical protein
MKISEKQICILMDIAEKYMQEVERQQIIKGGSMKDSYAQSQVNFVNNLLQDIRMQQSTDLREVEK